MWAMPRANPPPSATPMEGVRAIGCGNGLAGELAAEGLNRANDLPQIFHGEARIQTGRQQP